jgi:hypothetical protein
VRECLEAPGIDIIGRQRERIATVARLDDRRAEQLPQPQHVILQQLGRRARRSIAPDGVYEYLGTDRVADAQREHNEKCTLSRAPDRDDSIRIDDLKRTENPHLHRAETVLR